MRILFLLALLMSTSAVVAEDDGYSFTLTEAREAVRAHCRSECKENKFKPRLPYRRTFEKAMRGDIDALRTAFTDKN